MNPAASIDVGQIYSDHGIWLRRWLGARTRCPHRAADLAHDTFCRLLEKGIPAPLRDTRSYLAVVARRLLIDDVRRRDIEQAFLDAQMLATGTIDELTPERILESVELLDALLRLLRTMPDEVRDAFLLRRIDGLSHVEIAEKLGISDRTVKRHVARAYIACYDFAFAD